MEDFTAFRNSLDPLHRLLLQKSEEKDSVPSEHHPLTCGWQDHLCGRMRGGSFFKGKGFKGEYLHVPLRRPHQSGSLLPERCSKGVIIPGQFLVANAEKSSLLNEQNALILETEDRFKILLVQIAGFVARRIVCYAKTGDHLRMGEIFGLIRFGSRVDLYLPTGVKPIVKVGQHVKGGESIIGYRI